MEVRQLRSKTYLEKRRISFIYLVVDKRIFLLCGIYETGDHINAISVGCLNESGCIVVVFLILVTGGLFGICKGGMKIRNDLIL